MRLQTPYDPAYGTCAYTHAWLRIMSPELDPDEITHMLGVMPTETQFRGQPVDKMPEKTFSKSGWFLSTQGILDSKDSRHHLDWILDHIRDQNLAFSELHNRGYLIDLCVRWDSLRGDGGPTLSPKQMHELSALDIEVWFDVYID
jgi:Domain of unknown function (DUF4279)